MKWKPVPLPFFLITTCGFFLGLLAFFQGCGPDLNQGIEKPSSLLFEGANLNSSGNLPQGAHITGQITLPPLNSSFFIEEPFFNSPQKVAKINSSLLTVSNFSNFSILSSGISGEVASNGKFSLSNVPASNSLLLDALSGRIHLKRQLEQKINNGDQLENLEINFRTTATALLYHSALTIGKYRSLPDLEISTYTLGLENLLTQIYQASSTLVGLNPLNGIPIQNYLIQFQNSL